MPKRFSLRRYLTAPADAERLSVEVAELRRESESLRQRLIAAQKEKADALKRVEEFRRDKEQLRQRVAELKQSLKDLQRVNDHLGSTITDLRAAAEAADE